MVVDAIGAVRDASVWRVLRLVFVTLPHGYTTIRTDPARRLGTALRRVDEMSITDVEAPERPVIDPTDPEGPVPPNPQPDEDPKPEPLPEPVR